MEMPQPGEAHKKLAALVGEWSGEETMHPSPWDPAGGKAQGRVVNRSILDGFAVAQDYEQRRGGRITFRGHGVFWFDPAKQEYVINWWDSVGGIGGEFRGPFVDGVLTLSAPMREGGASRTRWDVSQPGVNRFRMEVSPDGQHWKPAMDGSYTKVRATAAPARKAAPAKKAAKKAAAKKVKAKPVRKPAQKKKR